MPINHSALKLYQSCSKKWQLQQQGAVADGKSGDMIFGSALHFALAKMMEGEEPAEAIVLYGMYWGTVKPDDYQWGRFGYDYYKGMGERFLAKFAKTYLQDIEPIWVEKKLQGVVNGVEVFGTPDVVARFQGKVSIIDFKTSSGNYEPEQAVVGTQMPYYHTLVEQQPGAPAIEQYVYLVFNKSKESLQKPVIAPATPELRAEHAGDIEAVLTEMATAPKSIRNTANCFSYNRKCEYFSQCWGSSKK